MKRTFIAIKIPLSRQAAELVGDIKLKLKDERIKWVDMWNIHLTLFFLGDTDEELIPEILKVLKHKLRDFKSFNLKCKEVGVFKNLKDPRVIWFGLEQNKSLQELKQHVNETLNQFGFDTENKKFKPHLTLGRVKHLKDKKVLEGIIEDNQNRIIQNIEVNDVILFESRLTPKGPIYSILGKAELN